MASISSIGSQSSVQQLQSLQATRQEQKVLNEPQAVAAPASGETLNQTAIKQNPNTARVEQQLQEQLTAGKSAALSQAKEAQVQQAAAQPTKTASDVLSGKVEIAYNASRDNSTQAVQSPAAQAASNAQPVSPQQPAVASVAQQDNQQAASAVEKAQQQNSSGRLAVTQYQANQSLLQPSSAQTKISEFA